MLELNAMDNLALHGGFARGAMGRVRWSEQEQETHRVLARFGVDLDIHRPLAAATPVERTVVAIAAALQGWQGGSGVLVLDEPTAVLPHDEVERLFAMVREVRAAGTSVLYVSHRLDEIFELADRVTVLRGGRVIATQPVSDIDAAGLASLMVGEEVDPDYRAPVAARPDAPVVLEARDVHGRWLRGVDLDVHRGEILGIAGLAGAGVLELPYVIAGCAQHAVSGRIRLPERSSEWTDVADAQDLDIPLVPADRGREGIVAEFAVSENLSLSVLGGLGRRGRLDRRAEAELVERWTQRLGVVAAGPGRRSRRSAAATSRRSWWHAASARDPALLVLCEPTAGVDIGTRVAIYDLIAELSRNGLTVVLSSSDAGDVLAMCTRVVVLRDGHDRRRAGRRRTHRARACERHGGRRPMTPTAVTEAATEPAASAQRPAPGTAAPRLRGTAARPRLRPHRRGLRLAGDHRAVLALGAGDVPEPRDREADPQRQRDHRAGRAVDHDPARGAGVRPLVRGRHDAHRGGRRASDRQGRRSARPGDRAGAGHRPRRRGHQRRRGRRHADRLVHRHAGDRVADRRAHHDGHERGADHRREARRRVRDIGQTNIDGVTLGVLYCAVVAVAIWYLLEHTATGRRLYATGFNPDAARLAGVRIDRLRFVSLVASGGLAGATGIILASTLGSGSPTAGTPYLLPAFAAAFLGATQLKHGRFNAGGTIIAVLLLGTGVTGLALANAPQWAGDMFVGVVLIAALALTGIQRRTTSGRRRAG